MGKRGPKKTPTAKLAARGSWRAKVREGEPEPPAVEGVSAPPEHLPGEAALVWAEVAPRLVGCGILTQADLHTFERYCRTYAAWRRAMAEIERAEAIERQMVINLQNLDGMLKQLEAAFGLNPADRADLRVEPKKQDDGKAKFFKPKLAV